jgi:CBS domain containing-hemolysin-like protein/mannitol/fructose-specific phosphotransferase system IIA component (Ntr-type)
MSIPIYLLIAVLLILLNAFFVLAEFAAVKVRSTQVEALAAKGIRRAKTVQYIQTHLDQFLSVCQIGITFASIGLGFVGEPALAHLFTPLLQRIGVGDSSIAAAHGIAITIAYLLVSYFHIVLGEQVPKMIAIRRTEKTALLIAYPMMVFYYLFFAPLWILNFSTNSFLKLFGVSKRHGKEEHSEDEIRIILDQSQSSGMMSLRRLLFIENVLDMGALTIGNAMKARDKVRVLTIGAPREENEGIVTQYRYSRYPAVNDEGVPLGFINIKDVQLARIAGKPTDDISLFVKPCLKAKEDDPLESILSLMQRKGMHLALVYNETGQWTGIITLEDVLEEVVGTIEEEYPVERTIQLTSTLKSQAQVVLDVEGSTIVAGVRNALSRIDPAILPIPVSEIMPRIAERERAGSSYIGRQLAIPHTRLKNISKAVLVVARFKKPIPAPNSLTNETIHFLFILITPTNEPRLHQILLARIAAIFESGYLESRLDEAATPQALYDAICTVEQATDLSL